MEMYKYLARIVNSQINNSSEVISSDDFTFEELKDIAIRNHIIYIMYTEMLKEKVYTEEQVREMRDAIKHSIMVTLFQMNEIGNLESQFEDKGVRNMVLKGSVLKRVYPRPEIREMSDIDVLIDMEDMEKADAVLNSKGYILHESVKHHDVYYKRPYIVLEAHKTLYDKTVDKNQYNYFLNLKERNLRENSKYTYEFSIEDFYVYMISHAAKHFYAMGCGIRNLIDVYVYLKEYRDKMDISYVEQELSKCGIKDFALHMEKLAFDWLEGKELDSFYLSLFQYMLDSGIYGKNENGIWNKFAQVNKEKISKLELKLWYYFPPLYYMSEYYPWLENKTYLLPIAWIIRFFRGLFMKKGTKKREMVKNIKNDQIMTYKQIYKKMNLVFSGK